MTGSELIAITQELWKQGYHDTDDDSCGELVHGAVCYCISPDRRLMREDDAPVGWPWNTASWHPSEDRIHELAVAGAMIAQAIDRLKACSTENKEPDGSLEV